MALTKSKKHFVGLTWADGDKKGGLAESHSSDGSLSGALAARIIDRNRSAHFARNSHAPIATARSTETISYVVSISALSRSIALTEQYFDSERWIASCSARSAMSTPVTMW